MERIKKLYRLGADKYIYIYSYGLGATLANWEIATLYKRAYSLRQAQVYLIRDIAKRLNVRYCDIDLDISDIETIED